MQPLDYQRKPAWAEVAPLKWRRVALASWLAPGISILIRLLLIPMLTLTTASALAIAALNGVILLAGLVCGLSGLWAVRRYGPRGLLMPATAGSALCGLLLLTLAGQVFGYFSAR